MLIPNAYSSIARRAASPCLPTRILRRNRGISRIPDLPKAQPPQHGCAHASSSDGMRRARSDSYEPSGSGDRAVRRICLSPLAEWAAEKQMAFLSARFSGNNGQRIRLYVWPGRPASVDLQFDRATLLNANNCVSVRKANFPFSSPP